MMTTILTSRSGQHGPQRRTTVATILNRLLITSVVAGTTLLAQTQSAIAATATATLDVTNNPTTVSPISVGLNLAAWDTNMTDPGFTTLLQGTYAQVMRYPGGSTADNFHWYNQSVDISGLPTWQGGGSVNSQLTFDKFMSVIPASSKAMITVNYGSGTPQEAAAWVNYANGGMNSGIYKATYSVASATGHTYGIKYWEIGNEVYGNGTYGTGTNQWEYDSHFNPAGPFRGSLFYATQVKNYAKAMTQVDNSIQIGAVLIPPTNWPETIPDPVATTNPQQPQYWNETVLKNACNSIDFVDIHWYPQAPASSGFGNESDAQLLGSAQNGAEDQRNDPRFLRTQGIATMMSMLNTAIKNNCSATSSPARTKPNPLQIMVTETNSVYGDPGKQTVSLVNALFEDDDIMTWLENGAANVDWWAAHNGPENFNHQAYVQQGRIIQNNFSSTLYGTSTFGDFGLLSTGGCVTIPPEAASGAGTCYTNPMTGQHITEPAAETAFPAYWGMQMLSATITPPQLPMANGGPLSFASITPSTAPATLSAYAVVQWNNPFMSMFHVSVLFINKDPSNSYTMTVNLQQLLGSSISFNTTSAPVFFYGQNSTAISQSSITPSSGSFTITLQPYSLNTVILTGVASL